LKSPHLHADTEALEHVLHSLLLLVQHVHAHIEAWHSTIAKDFEHPDTGKIALDALARSLSLGNRTL
jgi:hypothetical protein